MIDKTGREIEAGCCVDVFVSDIVTAYVLKVEDGGLVNTQGQMQPAELVLQVVIPMRFNPGQAANVYVVRQSDKPKSGQVVM